MLALFWDSQRRRPRAGVRLATHLALLALLLAAIGVAAPVLSPWIAGPIAFAGVIAITLGVTSLVLFLTNDDEPAKPAAAALPKKSSPWKNFTLAPVVTSQGGGAGASFRF